MRYDAPMTKSDAIRLAGSASKLADILNISPQAVSKWGDDIPPLQVYKLKERRPKWFKKATK